MEDFETQMNKWLGKIGGLANLTIEEREEANTAAAEVLKKSIVKVTPRNDNRKDGKLKHLADSVVIGNLQGTKSDGNIAVGYSTTDVNHARIARFQNDGTAKMPNPKSLHFYDRALADSKEDVFKARNDKLAEIQERKFKE
ncbi:HK97 gp10 family phage protein [Leuconostoc citreum]